MSRAATERRRDPLSGREVLIAPSRAGIGSPRRAAELPTIEGRCPFCPGNEIDTELALATWPSEGPWRIRVVDNRYPTLRFREAPSAGHEVVVEHSDHDADLPGYDPEHARALLDVWRNRLRALGAWPNCRAVLLFRNRGRRAGSSQPHPHTQVAALDFVPDEIARRTALAEEAVRGGGATLLERALEEAAKGGRLVRSESVASLITPFAPSRPHELHVVPHGRPSRLAEASDELLDGLTTLVVDGAARLATMTKRAAYNLVLREPSLEAGRSLGFHFELLPRLGGDAGFELATGSAIVVVPPEESARAARAVGARDVTDRGDTD